MSPDFIVYAIVAVVVVAAYALGRWHGRRAEQERAGRIAPIPSSNRTQDGPPPKGRV